MTGCRFSTTGESACHRFLFPRLPEGTTRLEFSVKVLSHAIVGLTTENRITDPMYKIGMYKESIKIIGDEAQLSQLSKMKPHMYGHPLRIHVWVGAC